MHIKGLGAEGGKTISSSVLEARQGSNIFSGWSHHFTVKDRCLVKAEPWQQEVTQRTAGWTFMLLINNSGTSFIHPHIDRQKKGFVSLRVTINHVEVCSSGAPEPHVITVSTDRTAAGLWLEKRLEGRTDSELEVITMYSTKSLPPNSRESGVFCYLRVVKM